MWSFHSALVFFACAAGSVVFAGCQPDTDSSTPQAALSSGTGSTPSQHLLRVNVVLSDDGQGIKLGTQNGGELHIPTTDVVGKPYYWITLPGGEIPGNGPFIEFGSGVMDMKASASYETSRIYEDGPWEMALFVSITGGAATDGPAAGDLAAFGNTLPPASEPPITGQSIRMSVHGADVEVTLDNSYFVQY